jgi:hypothetical protein
VPLNGEGTIEGRAEVLGAPAPPEVATSLKKLFDRQQPLRVRHLEQAEFQVKALLLLVSQFAVRAQHDLQMPREIFFAKQFRHALHALAFFAGDLQQGRVFAGNLGDGGIAQEAHHLPREVRRAVAFADEVVDLPQHFVAGADSSDGLHHFFQNVRGRRADQVAHGTQR